MCTSRNLFQTVVIYAIIAAASVALAQQSHQPPAINGSAATPYAINRIQSPDGNVAVDFMMQEGGVPAYKIEYLGRPIVLASRLGLEPDFDLRLSSDRNFYRLSQGPMDASLWRAQTGSGQLSRTERRFEAPVRPVDANYVPRYDEGAALRYSLPAQAEKEFKFTGERTEFRFPEDTYAYEEHATEGEYQRVKTGDIKPWCERPLTLEYASGVFASLAEADNRRYPRMLLSPLPDVPGALVSALAGRAPTPLRTVSGTTLTQNSPRANRRPGGCSSWAGNRAIFWSEII